MGTFAKVFHDRIQEKGMTEKAVAECAHIAPVALSAMLNGRRKIYATDFINLCHVLDLTPEDFIQPEEGTK